MPVLCVGGPAILPTGWLNLQYFRIVAQTSKHASTHKLGTIMARPSGRRVMNDDALNALHLVDIKTQRSLTARKLAASREVPRIRPLGLESMPEKHREYAAFSDSVLSKD